MNPPTPTHPSATPRTQAQLLPINSHTLPDDVVYASFARTLETELARLRAEVERLTACLKTANGNHEEFERKFYLEQDRAERAEAALAAAKDTIEQVCTGGRLTCDDCQQTMPCMCGHKK